MKVKLLHITPIEMAIIAIRECYDSFDKSDSYNETFSDYSNSTNLAKSVHSYYNPKFIVGPKDKALIERVIDSGHTSTLEHINVTFKLEGWSRLLLQELARHRIASYSIKSTRYTLKELKEEESFIVFDQEYLYDFKRAEKYINFSGNINVDNMSILALENLRCLIALGDIPNDITKYCLPECYKFNGVVTMNIRSMMNFLELRTSKKAHSEIRKLAYAMFEVIPENYRFMLDKSVYKEEYV